MDTPDTENQKEWPTGYLEDQKTMPAVPASIKSPKVVFQYAVTTAMVKELIMRDAAVIGQDHVTADQIVISWETAFVDVTIDLDAENKRAGDARREIQDTVRALGARDDDHTLDRLAAGQATARACADVEERRRRGEPAPALSPEAEALAAEVQAELRGEVV